MKRRIETGANPCIIPWALFLGVACGFVACCMAGRKTTEIHQLTEVNRFHQLITPEALFYPTASQVKQLALYRTKKAKINVIIGGVPFSMVPVSRLTSCGQANWPGCLARSTRLSIWASVRPPWERWALSVQK
ncbi:hypothetical protein DES53_101244 [Roseimicrobium gellanilyticum]|uniref:Uncharacterized protein n=1 Tax=Roseimicrobium gellanilyticum TaxID=748857 RepID=A0A366HTN5_9BACT|nr:hypothetical protein DES53_101244 [Roseimicrobium gellanilyticum]